MDKFRGVHSGQTALLVGNGINLNLTPPTAFNYPSFGMNTVYKYNGWTPDYYTAVDTRVMNEFGKEIAEKYADIPKFIPRPNLDNWQGSNFYRFLHRPGAIVPLTDPARDGIAYSNVMTVAMQLAAYMGFTTLLMIGVYHDPNDGRGHFWGRDEGMPLQPPLNDWLEAYKQIVDALFIRGVQVLNISVNTHVSESVLPRGNWQDWSNT